MVKLQIVLIFFRKQTKNICKYLHFLYFLIFTLLDLNTRSCSILQNCYYYKLYLFPQYRYVLNWISPVIHYLYHFIDYGLISGYVTSCCVSRRAWSCSSGKQRRPARRSWRRPPAAWGPRSRRSGSRNSWEEHRSDQRALVFRFNFQYRTVVLIEQQTFYLSFL